MKKNAVVLGAGGFIGSHMVSRLKNEDYWVCGVDLKKPEYSTSDADLFILGDLSDFSTLEGIFESFEHDIHEIYQFAADMGGAGYIFTGENDTRVMVNSGLINLNLTRLVSSYWEKRKFQSLKLFYSSSACIYPARNQVNPDNPICSEDSAYPAEPDSEYGWEKLFSERLYGALNRNYGVDVYIARYHNIYGPEGTWTGGKEKAPAAICRKIAELPEKDGVLEIWGDGNQTRSFLYIDDCIEATRRLVKSDYHLPINIGSEEMVTINSLVDIVAGFAGKEFNREYLLDKPQGVKGRNSDNQLIRNVLDWDYSVSLNDGLALTYQWISLQLSRTRNFK